MSDVYKKDFIYVHRVQGSDPETGAPIFGAPEKVAIADMVGKLHEGYEQCRPPEGEKAEKEN